jgi:WD40 repeat protein/tetratricopeptide (TPR) repeat protein
MISPTDLSHRLPDLIDELREAGYPIGIDQYVAAQDLLLALAGRGALPDDPGRYRTLLGPIFCKSAQQQEDFQVRFDRWIARGLVSAKRDTTQELRRELNEVEQGARVWRLALIGGSIAALILALFNYSSPKPSARTSAPIHTTPDEVTPTQDGMGAKTPVISQGVSSDPTPITSPLKSVGDHETSESVPSSPSDVKTAQGIGEFTSASAPPNDATAEIQPAMPKAPESPPPGATTQPGINRVTVLLTTLFLLVTGLLGWRFWWVYRARVFLRRMTTSEIPDLTRVSIKGAGGELFRDFGLARTAQRLRHRRLTASDRIDVRATIGSTVRNAGWFTPVPGRLLLIPEYLVLIDRASHHDHQARFFDEWIERLAQDEVVIARYEFDNDPRICHPASSVADAVTIRELAARHPEHRLLIISSGMGLMNPLTVEVAAWAEQFARWPERVLLTPEATDHWGYRELALARHGFLVLPATEEGLAALAADPGQVVDLGQNRSSNSSPPFPELLRERPRRWLEQNEPAPDLLNEMLRALRAYLGEDGYQWLAACAVYPSVHWDLTLHLGYTLRTTEGRRFLESKRLSALARLPWFRHGWMPDWLRAALIRSLPRDQEQVIRAALQALLLTASEGEAEGLVLEIARTRRSVLAPLAKQVFRTLQHRAPNDSPLRDYVFASYMIGRKPSPLVFEPPKELAVRFLGADVFRQEQVMRGKPRRPHAARLRAAENSQARWSRILGAAYVFASYMIGRKPSPLVFEPPKELAVRFLGADVFRQEQVMRGKPRRPHAARLRAAENSQARWSRILGAATAAALLLTVSLAIYLIRGRIRSGDADQAAKEALSWQEVADQAAREALSWQEVARLEPPFDRVDQVFDPARVVVDGDGVGPRVADAPTAETGPVSSTFLPSRVMCQGNAQLDVTLRAGSWDTAGRIDLLLYDNLWHTGPVRGLAYEQTGKTLIIVDDRGVTRLWDIQARSTWSLAPPPVGSISLAFGLPSGLAAKGLDAGTPELRDVALGETIREGRTVRIGQLVAAVAPGGAAVALATPGGRVFLFAAREESLHRVREYRLKGEDVLCLAVADGGRMMAAGTRDGSILLLDPASETPRAIRKGHTGEVNALAFHREGALLASGGVDTKIHLWDVAKAAPQPVLSGHGSKITALAFSPDGRTLAGGELDAAVRLWNLATEHPGAPLTGHTPSVSSLAFSSDGRTLAVAHGLGVTIWDTRASRPLEVLRPQHYALQLLATRPTASLGSRRATSKSITFGDAIAANRPLVVRLARDGQVLREQDVSLRSRGPLALSARLEGDKLELLINGMQSVVFQDLFPLGRAARGFFGLDLPPTARIERLVASRQRPPQLPSWMEKGDELYAKGDFSGALDAYRKLVRDAANSQVGQEAKCKEGVCLVALGQAEDAIQVFQQLKAEPGERWPVIAGCRLWLLHLQRKELDEAYAVYAELSSQRRLEQIAALVPADIPAAIVKAYAPTSSYSHFVRNPKLVPDLELALAIARDIRAPADQQTRIKWLLAVAYHEDGQLERAAASYAEFLAGPPLPPPDEALVMEHYGWVLGRLKKDQVALAELDRRIAAGRDANPFLFICRAQIRARQGRWAAARDDIDEYFRHRTDQDGDWLYEGCLIRGFIREALGDAGGARESWREGYRAASGTEDMGLLTCSMLGSLSGELTPDDARIMFNTVLGGLPENFAPMRMAESLKFRFDDIISGLRTLWSSPRGREYARKIALLDISFSDYIQIQVPLVVAEICRYGAFGGTLTPDDDELLWMMVQNLFQDYMDHSLTEVQLVQLMTTWIGIPLTWSLAARTMRPESRGPLAYVFGSRLELIGRPNDARTLFRVALEDSRPGTLLRRRAQAALDRLDARK